MNAYCIFCDTVNRGKIAGIIARNYDYRVITPKIVQRKWVGKTPLEVVHDFLPGYIFLYAEEPIENFIKLLRIDGVFRVLGQRENGNRLRGSDLGFAEMLLNCDGTIGILKTYREGDRVKLAHGALGGIEGEIIKLDRRGRAEVQYAFDGVTYKVWVGYEIIDDGPVKPEYGKSAGNGEKTAT